MKKRFILLTLIVLIGSVMPGPARAQSDPLICDQFPDGPTDVRVSYYMGEGMGYFESGSLAQALDSFSCVTDQIDSGYLPAYVSRAAVYAEYRSFDEAIEDYNTAISLDSAFLAAYNNRGIVYAAQQKYDEALADFSQVLTLDASFDLGYTNRGVIYAIQGKYDESIADFQQAITLSGMDAVLADLTDPDRDPEEPKPEIDPRQALPYAMLGIVYEMRARDNYNSYLTLAGSQADNRIQSAAGALQSRFSFDLRLDDGTWLFAASFSPAGG